jgi:hypothetical protein
LLKKEKGIIFQAGDITQVAVRLPNKCEALSSNPSATKKNVFYVYKEKALKEYINNALEESTKGELRFLIFTE